MSDEGNSTALEIEQDDDNIERIHERKSLLSEGKRKAKSPTCKVMLCKALVLTVAGILFILMMVELWGDYGNVIQSQTIFTPRVYSIMESCPPNSEDTVQLKKQYNPMDCRWDVAPNGTKLHCDGSMPANPMVLPSSKPGHTLLETDASSMCLTWENINISRCVRLLIYSI